MSAKVVDIKTVKEQKAKTKKEKEKDYVKKIIDYSKSLDW